MLRSLRGRLAVPHSPVWTTRPVAHRRFATSSAAPTSAAAAVQPFAPRLTASSDLRASFLAYFRRKQHQIIPSSSLVPDAADASLLFTNAGMVQLKDMLVGVRPPPAGSHGRLASVQKCLRAGGKHNDLENVGYTARHHTFFEMLGNFSVGAYFKEEAMVLAWEYLTKELAIPHERLRISVHQSDDESMRLWQRISGFTEAPAGSTLATAGVGGKIVRLGDADNFWSMGDSAGTPCGPCSEIFFDQGSAVDGDRWLEIWNLVFMQYARGDQPGELRPLEKPCVDTGMGLERVAAVLQGQPTNYDSDLLRPSIDAARELVLSQTGRSRVDLPYTNGLDTAPHATALKVIVDHLRASSFLIADGVTPSNIGRGYVLRRIIRRAVRYGQTVGLTKPFLSQLLPTLLVTLGPTYPELHERLETIRTTLEHEEMNFFATLGRGIRVLEEAFAKAGMTPASPAGSNASSSTSIHSSSGKVLPGSLAFLLYDSYGFPLDLTQVIARERGATVDTQEFERLMDQQKERSKGGGFHTSGSTVQTSPTTAATAAAGSTATAAEPTLVATPNLPVPLEVKKWSAISTEFLGYTTLRHRAARILAAHYDRPGHSVWVAVDRSPFYAASGGQVGDVGVIETGGAGGDKHTWQVVDTLKAFPGCDVLRVHVPSTTLDELVSRTFHPDGLVASMQVDPLHRHATSVHHTATHLLHAALKATLARPGSKINAAAVNQAGSLVHAERLRFDFSCPAPLNQTQLTQLEQWVNEAALSEDRAEVVPPGDASSSSSPPSSTSSSPPSSPSSGSVLASTMSRSDASKLNATALFGEKYGEVVRVVRIPGFSTELCGGTHVAHARSVHPFVIVGEQGIASGVRRIEALAGEPARRYLDDQRQAIKRIASELKVQPVSEASSGGASSSSATADGILHAWSKLKARAADLEKKLRLVQCDAIRSARAQAGATHTGVLDWPGLSDAQRARRLPFVLSVIPLAQADPPAMKEVAMQLAKDGAAADQAPACHVLVCASSGEVVVAAPGSGAGASAADAKAPLLAARLVWQRLAEACVDPTAAAAGKKARGGGGAEVAQGVLPLPPTDAPEAEATQRALVERVRVALSGKR